MLGSGRVLHLLTASAGRSTFKGNSHREASRRHDESGEKPLFGSSFPLVVLKTRRCQVRLPSFAFVLTKRPSRAHVDQNTRATNFRSENFFALAALLRTIFFYHATRPKLRQRPKQRLRLKQRPNQRQRLRLRHRSTPKRGPRLQPKLKWSGDGN